MSDATTAAARVATLRAQLVPSTNPASAAAHAAATSASASTAAGTPPAGPPPPVDVRALNLLLDHDNYATRDALKELMKSPLFVP
jgi:hypothetical protein